MKRKKITRLLDSIDANTREQLARARAEYDRIDGKSSEAAAAAKRDAWSECVRLQQTLQTLAYVQYKITTL